MENIMEGADLDTRILYPTSPWDGRGRDVEEIEVRVRRTFWLM
jgi:hypothetical protein